MNKMCLWKILHVHSRVENILDRSKMIILKHISYISGFCSDSFKFLFCKRWDINKFFCTQTHTCLIGYLILWALNTIKAAVCHLGLMKSPESRGTDHTARRGGNLMKNKICIGNCDGLKCLAQGKALLGGMALWQWVWPCWRKCAIVAMGFKTLILDTRKTVFSCLPSEQGVKL